VNARPVVAMVMAGILAPGPAGAQSVDVYYRSWRWLKEPSAPRPAGLAGASVALPDDAGAAEANPALLTSLSKSEVRGTLLSRASGTTATGDAVSAGTGIGFLGFGGRLNPRWALGAYVLEPQSAHVESASTPPAGVTETGTLDGTVREAGLSLAWRPHTRLHLGLRLSANSLSLEGRYRTASSQGGPVVEVESGGESTATAVSWGVLFEAGPRVRVGLARLGGATWDAPRTTRIETPFGTALTPADSEVRQPTVTSGGLSYQASPRVLLTGQLDYVRYGEIQTPFASQPDGGAAARYALYAWEPRAGVEVSLPFRTVSVQLRGGVRGRGAAGAEAQPARATQATLVVPTTPQAMPAPTPLPSPAPFPPAPTGPDTARAAASLATQALLPEAPPAREEPGTRVSAGASVVLDNGLSFDVAGLFRGERPSVWFGLGLRF
jgi:hypothetical protein